METKTRVIADEGKQYLEIFREFDLPVRLLFKAYTEPSLVERWMGNKVLKMENRAHGGYIFETRDPQGNILFRANGTIHGIIENQNITRTFEMENSSFPVQLEFLDFEPLTDEKSRLSMRIVFRSPADRDNLLKLPFSYGINMAHDRLEQLFGNATKSK